MNELELPDLFDAAARATINARCAPAYLHDVRGSLQALYSALELLGRSARSNGDNMLKVERACDLAKRAIGFHEKSTLGVLELLTATNSSATVFDVEQLASEAVHFLRNDAAMRSIKITLEGGQRPLVSAERNKFQVLLVGLLTASIDESVNGANLVIHVERKGELAVLSLGTRAGYDERLAPDWGKTSTARLQPRELTFLFARNFLGANGGRLLTGPRPDSESVLQIYYPCIGPTAQVGADLIGRS